MDYESELRKFEIVCESCLVEYLDLINSEYETDCYCENHHVLPKCMFPQYANDKWNIKRLPYNKHIEAHKLLNSAYRNAGLAIAYRFMCKMSGTKIDDYVSLKEAMKGDNNPAKKPDVRELIRQSKIGVKRPDMIGKSFMGASDDVKQKISEISSKTHSGMVSVEDSDGKRFKVSVNDNRYLSGELVSHNKGKKRPNNAMKNEEIKNRQLSNRVSKYEKFKTYSETDMVEFLIDSYLKGKKIFTKTGDKFSSNFSYYINLSGFAKDSLFEIVVQRLEKDGY